MNDGRKNCAKCTRWRHLIDYRWQWRGDKIRIDGTCNACRRSLDRKRYYSKSLEERQAIGRRANENKRRRQQEKLLIAQRAVREHRYQLGLQDRVSLTPLRMWLLRRIRLSGSVSRLADEINFDREQLARYANGYYWSSDCTPVPIYAVNLATVDELLQAAGEPHQLYILYPLESDRI